MRTLHAHAIGSSRRNFESRVHARHICLKQCTQALVLAAERGTASLWQSALQNTNISTSTSTNTNSQTEMRNGKSAGAVSLCFAIGYVATCTLRSVACASCALVSASASCCRSSAFSIASACGTDERSRKSWIRQAVTAADKTAATVTTSPHSRETAHGTAVHTLGCSARAAARSYANSSKLERPAATRVLHARKRGAWHQRGTIERAAVNMQHAPTQCDGAPVAATVATMVASAAPVSPRSASPIWSSPLRTYRSSTVLAL